MSYIYKNITGSGATLIDSISSGIHEYKSLSICNMHAADSAAISLYITRTADGGESSSGDTRTIVGQDGNWDPLPTTQFDYYILKNMVIPKGVTLNLDSNDLSFDNTLYNLYIQSSAVDSTLDVILYKIN